MLSMSLIRIGGYLIRYLISFHLLSHPQSSIGGYLGLYLGVSLLQVNQSTGLRNTIIVKKQTLLIVNCELCFQVC